MRKPESMDECVYFTRRSIDNGKIMAWVFKKQCSKCGSGFMVKPPNKSGNPDKKSPIYVCNKCGHEEDNTTVESDLVVNVEYTCPHCLHEGQTTTEYKRKKIKGILSYVFECEKCKEQISISKKLKGV